MNNYSLAALEAVRKILASNPSIQVKSDQADIQLTEALLAKFTFNGTVFFDKRTQQSVDDLPREVFVTAKSLGILVSNTRGQFNHQLSSRWTPAQNEMAVEKTKEAIDKYFQKKGIKFQGEDYGNKDARNIVIGKIVRAGLVAESDGNGGIQFRKLGQVGKGSYWSKSFKGEEVIGQFAKPYIDQDASDLAKLEIEASIREKVNRLLPADSKQNKTMEEMRKDGLAQQDLFNKLMQQHNNLRFQYVIPDVAGEQELIPEFEKFSMWRAGVNIAFAVLSEKRSATGEALELVREINNFDVPPVGDHDKVYTDFSKVVIPY